MDPIPDQDQEENIENITDPDLERIEGGNIYLLNRVFLYNSIIFILIEI